MKHRRLKSRKRDAPLFDFPSSNTFPTIQFPANRSPPNGPTVALASKRAAPRPTIVFDTYWRFATERQEIYHRRTQGLPQPWTHDPILASYKFTNAYRAADRVSQFLIQNVIYGEPHDAQDTVFRTLLFKIFNKPETWNLLEADVDSLCIRQFDLSRFDTILNSAIVSGRAIYSGAYIMPSGPKSIRRLRKHRMHLELLSKMLQQGVIERLTTAKSMAEAYRLLIAVPSIGPFLAYQFSTDINYSQHFAFSEMEFVVPGPGARDGIRKCFSSLGDYTEAELIRWAADRQDEEFATRGLDFKSLWGRPLQLIDCQNLFCEVDKYARVAHPETQGYSGRTRIKHRFSPDPRPLRPWFPPKWGINERINPVSVTHSVSGSRAL